MEKVARVKEARKRRGKGQEKCLKRAMEKKNAYAHAPNQNIPHLCAQSCGNLSVWSKIAFSVKLWPI